MWKLELSIQFVLKVHTELREGEIGQSSESIVLRIGRLWQTEKER